MLNKVMGTAPCCYVLARLAAQQTTYHQSSQAGGQSLKIRGPRVLKFCAWHTPVRWPTALAKAAKKGPPPHCHAPAAIVSWSRGNGGRPRVLSRTEELFLVRKKNRKAGTGADTCPAKAPQSKAGRRKIRHEARSHRHGAEGEPALRPRRRKKRWPRLGVGFKESVSRCFSGLFCRLMNALGQRHNTPPWRGRKTGISKLRAASAGTP